MSYQMLRMIYLRCLEKANASIEGTKEYYEHMKNASEYFDMMKELTKKLESWS